jgi:GNAT superfamily N-acetyltransferase
MRLRPWDSDFFGAKIGSADLDEESLASAVRAARAQSVDCLYLVASGDRLPELASLTRQGARLVTLRHTLEWNANGDPRRAGNDPEKAETVRLATAGDRSAVRQLAEGLAPFSRFAADSRFDAERIGAMYRLWADQCLGEGVVAVAADGAGFVGVTLPESQADVALVYVTEASSGRGLGRALLDAALDAAGRRSAVVATDTGNIPALRMYESAGFRTKSMNAIFHLWLDELEGDGEVA